MIIILIILSAYMAVLLRHQYKPMPSGTDYESPVYHVAPQDVEFFYDLRYKDGNGKIVFEESIYPQIFRAVKSARSSVLTDMFLYNSDHAVDIQDPEHRPNTRALTELLCAKGEQGLDVLLITDEINNFYGSYESPILKKARSHNVKTVVTRLDRLRDSNFFYSAWYRLFVGWIPLQGPAILWHPFGHPERRITFLSFLRSLNFKANHRKVLVVDSNYAIITSANPHDPSSLHCNIAFSIKGDFAKEVKYAEHAVAAFSGCMVPGFMRNPPAYPHSVDEESLVPGSDRYHVQLLTEKKVKDWLLREIQHTAKGELIMLAALYLTDRQVIQEIKEAAVRGAEIRIILDSSEHAFGLKKYGIPNKHASLDFYRDPCFGRNLNVRWYKTHGEQFHSKIAAFKRRNSFVVLGGSSNFTKKNLNNYNLEMGLRIVTSSQSSLCDDVTGYFERLWMNRQREYTLDYELLKDENRLKYILYRIQEATGMCTY